MLRNISWRYFDFWLLGAVVLATTFGTTMIRSAVAGNEVLLPLINRQIYFALVGLALITIGSRVGWIPFMPVQGASGVMFGILFAVAYMNPNQQVMLMIPPIPMKMKTLVIVFCALELAFGVFGTSNGLAHLGFLGGMLGAWLHIRYWRGEPPFTKKRPPGPRLVR